MKLVKQFHLSIIKPILYVANVSEDEVADASANEYAAKVREYAASEGAEVIVVCARIESEIAELEGKKKQCSLKN